jgi:putative heme-binding domain-containing protein
MLESIIEPNKTISDQFASTVFYLKDGSSVVGKMINEDEKNYFIGQNPFAMHVVKEVAKKNVIRKRLSKESFMMSGLINRLNPEELKDLLAYMKSGGNPKDSLFIAKSNN